MRSSHPSRFTLILYSLFGVCNSPLHKAYRLVHVVLYAVNHGSLAEEEECRKQDREAEADSVSHLGCGRCKAGSP